MDNQLLLVVLLIILILQRHFCIAYSDNVQYASHLADHGQTTT